MNITIKDRTLGIERDIPSIRSWRSKWDWNRRKEKKIERDIPSIKNWIRRRSLPEGEMESQETNSFYVLRFAFWPSHSFWNVPDFSSDPLHMPLTI